MILEHIVFVVLFLKLFLHFRLACFQLILIGFHTFDDSSGPFVLLMHIIERNLTVSQMQLCLFFIPLQLLLVLLKLFLICLPLINALGDCVFIVVEHLLEQGILLFQFLNLSSL
uniref:Uncharacterized protein n=1 Tax=Cacopsylla melanoneura TaxID=428564 RepID=A0A8D9EHS6_9HEMI